MINKFCNFANLSTLHSGIIIKFQIYFMSVDNKKRVLIVASELSPYVEFTEFAHILNKLAIKTFEQGIEVRVIMPRFGTINERRHKLHEVVRLSGINIAIENDDYPVVIKVASLPNARLQVYFMDNEDFYKRKAVYRDEDGQFFDDNADRMVFFAKSALETVKKFGWPPHVVHCHGWMSALVPLYLKTVYKKEPVFSFSKSVFTLQNNQFSEKLDAGFFEKAQYKDLIKEKEFEPFAEGTSAAIMKAASKYADVVVLGESDIDDDLLAAAKPSKTKKVVKFSENWLQDVSPLLEMYQTLTEG